jgi:16S rRNA (uracil1498-N3)-methyltransferase
MQVQTTDTLPSYQGPYPNLVLLQCLCKGKKEEQIFRQATEIGAATLALVSSRYCVTDLSDKKEKAVQARFERLDAQIKEALQQSGSPIPTHLVPEVLELKDVPTWWADRGLAMFFHQSMRSEKQETLTSLLNPLHVPVCVLIGPEGGFSDEECLFLEQSGFHPVLLKTNILRSETAGLYALSAIQVLLTEA